MAESNIQINYGTRGKMMNILITGAAGFIGLHLTKALVEKGHRVRGLLLPQEDGQALEIPGVEMFRGNLTRQKTLAGVAEGMDNISKWVDTCYR